MQNKNAKTPSIQSTNNYSLFVSHEYQQPISDGHVLALAESIQNNGFLQSKPLQVYVKDGKFHVIDGHHRLEAAKLADSFVYFVVDPEEHSDLIGQENVLVKKWSTESFIKMYAAKGRQDYIILQSYIGKGIPTSTLLNLLGKADGAYGPGKSFIKRVQMGQYKIRVEKLVQSVLYVLDLTREYCPHLNFRYVSALAHYLHIPEFDVEHFVRQVNINPRSVIPAATLLQAAQIMEEVYNYRVRQEQRVELFALYKKYMQSLLAQYSRATITKLHQLYPEKVKIGQFKKGGQS